MLKSSILFSFFFLSFFLFISFLSTLQQQSMIFELDTGQLPPSPPGKHACPCMNWARLPSCSLCYGARCSHSLRGTMKGSVFVSGQPSSSQVPRASIPIRAPDWFALRVSCSINLTSSSTTIEHQLKFPVPRINKSVSRSMLYWARW